MKYSLGLDLGTTSIGWAIINEDKQRIEDLGVRIFEIPENPKNGESLAVPRRTARSARRRIKRRRQRLDYLKNFFIQHHFITAKRIAELLSPTNIYDPYLLRTKAANQKVSNEELFLAIYHIAKRRGYKSNRKKVEESDKENSKILSAIKTNSSLLSQYATIGSVLAQDEKFKARKRNSYENYQNSFIRADFEKEARLILEQQGWSQDLISQLFHDPAKKWGGIFDQRPFMTESLIKKMQGNCPLEQGEKRAPKASYTFELFRLAQDLAHLTYNDSTKLTPDQIALIIENAKNTQSITYKKVRELIGYKNDPDFRFDYIRGKKEKTYEDEEKHQFCNLKFYHAIKKATAENDWSKIENNIELFDRIGEILTVNKDDEAIRASFAQLDLDNISIENFLSLNFSGFGHLSIKAIRKITPYLLQGNTYDKALENVYPGEFTQKLHGDKTYLPPLSDNERNQITNPVVKRAIGQCRKLVNAIIGKYGSPYQIKIECTNELAKNTKDRKQIEKMQRENEDRNTKIVDKLREFGIIPTGTQITKYKLRELQSGQCMYCGKALGIEIFQDDKASEIDHIIPFSRCGNDGLVNKVLTCTQCNQEKRNQTPYECWHSNQARWEGIIARANSSTIPFKKRDRILAEKAPKEDWTQHALNDTRYIMKFLAQYIRKNLQFSEDSDRKQKVILPTGMTTSYLRKMYHLGRKNRELNNCHHAVDACIIASVSQAQIRRFALWNKYKELGAKYSATVNFDENGEIHTITKREYEELTQELLPWSDFDKEVEIRSGMNYDQDQIENLSDFRDKFRNFASYDNDFLQKIHPLFVSRMPKRSIKGQLHEETLRSPKINDNGERLTRVRLSSAKRKHVENSVIRNSDPILYKQLLKRIEDFGEKDAFKEPVYKNNKKFDKRGKPISPVSTIKVFDKKPNGFLLNHGTQFADNGKTVCLNIYRRKDFQGKDKYFAAPIYAHSVHAKAVELLPNPNGHSADEKAFYDSLRNPNGKIYATPENGFEKVFSVYPNDYLRITYEDHVTEGYYVKYGIGNGVINLSRHNQTSKGDLDLIHCSLGKTNTVQLLNISILGDNYKPSAS